MVNEVVSSQILDMKAAPAARPAAAPPAAAAAVAVSAAARPPAATGGNDLPRPPPPQPPDLSRVTEGLNRYLQASSRNLNFRVDESSGRTIITVINPETEEVVRQIPPEELLNMARTMRDAGMLFDAIA